MAMSVSYGTKTNIRSHISGTASSVAFTPMNGIEIVNPQAVDTTIKDGTETAKYFSSTTGFKSTIPKQ